jgi:Protein of unknown function (DUF3043)
VRVFRRRNAGAGGTVEETTDGANPGTPESSANRQAGGATTPAKGRPTPKRSESERRRRQPNAPGDKKAATQQSRTRDRTERARKYDAMKRGEDWALAARDKGPVKGLTRDYVDSRRRFSEYYMYILVVLLLALLVRDNAVKVFMYPVVLIMVVIIATEGTMISRKVRKLAAVRFPGQSTRGITMYAIMRTLQIRKFRMPAPRIKPGTKVE